MVKGLYLVLLVIWVVFLAFRYFKIDIGNISKWSYLPYYMLIFSFTDENEITDCYGVIA
jgi:hypothetical protein